MEDYYGSPSGHPHWPIFGAFLEDGKFSDLTIVCGDRTFKAHRIVVCAQSEFFDVACSSLFKVRLQWVFSHIDRVPSKLCVSKNPILILELTYSRKHMKES